MSRWPGPAIVAVTGVALAAVTWRRWPDVLVDFGREAYTAWRLAEGDALYRDIAWFNGPLSAYWNALWMAVFGPSLTVLFAVNLLLLATFIALAYRTVLDLSDRLTATAACLLVLLLFAFSQLTDVGNYNFVAPYSHEATHGLLCGLAAVACVGRWARTPGRRWLVAAGMFSGLAMLTKAEMALAGLAAPLAGLVLSGRFLNRGRSGSAVLTFIAAALSVLAIAFLALLAYSGMETAQAGLTAPWRGLLAREVMALRFYRIGSGFDDAPGRLWTMGLWTLGWGLALSPAVAAAFLLRSDRWRRRIPLFIVPALFAGALFLAHAWTDWGWINVATPLPVIAAVVAIASFTLRPRSADSLAACVLALYALAVLAKMLLYPRLHHYGFVLAVPATLLAVVALLHWIPAWVQRAGGRGELVRAAALGVLAVPCTFYVATSLHQLGLKTESVATGGDAFLAGAHGALVAKALDALSSTPAGETLAVLPEGAMLNYLARRSNPTPYIVFLPPELLLFGEDAMLAAFAAHPPDRIALVHRDTREYGTGQFGRDYGQRLTGWVSANYRVEHALGDAPFEPGSTFGIWILARR